VVREIDFQRSGHQGRLLASGISAVAPMAWPLLARRPQLPPAVHAGHRVKSHLATARGTGDGVYRTALPLRLASTRSRPVRAAGLEYRLMGQWFFFFLFFLLDCPTIRPASICVVGLPVVCVRRGFPADEARSAATTLPPDPPPGRTVPGWPNRRCAEARCNSADGL